MTELYLDIETTGVNFERDSVIAVALQPVSPNGRAEGDLEVLSRWELGGEKQVLEQVVERGVFDFGLNPFDCILTGTNLLFDLSFLITRMMALGIRNWTVQEVFSFLRRRPMKDLKYTLVFMNGGKFKDSGLDTFTTKKRTSGRIVLELWQKQDFPAIERYIRDDAEGFLDVYRQIAPALSDLGKNVRRPMSLPR
jgi:hypothetical protein